MWSLISAGRLSIDRDADVVASIWSASSMETGRKGSIFTILADSFCFPSCTNQLLRPSQKEWRTWFMVADGRRRDDRGWK